MLIISSSPIIKLINKQPFCLIISQYKHISEEQLDNKAIGSAKSSRRKDRSNNKQKKQARSWKWWTEMMSKKLPEATKSRRGAFLHFNALSYRIFIKNFGFFPSFFKNVLETRPRMNIETKKFDPKWSAEAPFESWSDLLITQAKPIRSGWRTESICWAPIRLACPPSKL